MHIDHKIETIKPIPKSHWDNLELGYYAEEDMEYLCDDLLGVTPQECNAYQSACTELYKMYEQAAQYVIDNNLWRDLGIPSNAIEIIKYSWNQRHRLQHLYGRFDIAGVIDGKQAKLIEFNADTATVMPETAVIQKEMLAQSHIKTSSQFNNLFDGLTDKFKQILNANPNKEASILLSDLGHIEDELNLDIIDEAAEEAGFLVEIASLSDVHFSKEEGICLQVGEDEFMQFDFWFKLVPWEWIAYEEPELLDILTEIVKKEMCVILNPAYTLIFQSKAIMKILWDLFPNHPLLLRTTNSKSSMLGKPFVEKVIFGREGENISCYNEQGRVLYKNGGDFGNYPNIYQEYYELPQDEDGDYYQAGMYFTYKPIALSYRRRDGLVTDTDSEFIGHFIQV